MIIHIDPLYRQHMEQDEYSRLCYAMVEFEKYVEEYHGQGPPDVETSFLWRIETDRDGHKIDVLSLRFSYAGRNLIFPLTDAWKSGNVAVDILDQYELALKFEVPGKRRKHHDNPDDILRLIDFSGESSGNLSRNPNS